MNIVIHDYMGLENEDTDRLDPPEPRIKSDGEKFDNEMRGIDDDAESLSD